MMLPPFPNPPTFTPLLHSRGLRATRAGCPRQESNRTPLLRQCDPPLDGLLARLPSPRGRCWMARSPEGRSPTGAAGGNGVLAVRLHDDGLKVEEIETPSP